MKALFVFFILIAIPHSSRADNQCLNLFSFRKTSLNDFSRTEIQGTERVLSTNVYGHPIKQGYVLMIGLSKKTNTWLHLGLLEYKIKDTKIIIERLNDNQSYHGHGIYMSLISAIMEKNSNTDSITTSITGDFFKKYQSDLRRLGSQEQALANNPVSLELAKLGFTQITAAFELDNPQQSYLRITYSNR